jgi:hypothetical protein
MLRRYFSIFNVLTAVLTAVSILLFAAVPAYAEAPLKYSPDIVFTLYGMSDVKDGPDNKSRVFAPGGKVWINLKAAGLLKNKNKKFKVQVDFAVMAEGVKEPLRKGAVIDQEVDADGTNYIEFTVAIDLKDDIKKGRYIAEINVKDLVAGRYSKFRPPFDVK